MLMLPIVTVVVSAVSVIIIFVAIVSTLISCWSIIALLIDKLFLFLYTSFV